MMELLERLYFICRRFRLISKVGHQISRYRCCLENEVNLTLKGKEEYVGIQEYVGSHSKFKAQVKERCSHFHVHEIGLDGKLVELTDLKPPVMIGLYLLHEFVSTIATRSLAVICRAETYDPQITHETHESRKTEVHPPNEPYYVHCTLYKEKYATPDITKLLIRELGLNFSDISMAGIKDKWGKTSQRISIYNVEPHRLAELFEKSRRIKLGNFVFATEPLTPGDLNGNHFKILLLNMTSPSGSTPITKDVEKAVTSLKEFGFINYYGLQRFSFGHKNQVIGRAVLQMNWEQVFDMILQPGKYDSKVMSKAKHLWLSKRDPIEIMKILPADMGSEQNSQEKWLFKGLAEHYNEGKGDLLKAYKTIPKYLRKMFYSSFKSFLWNHLLSFRLREFGHKPVPGDVVNVETHSNNDSTNGLEQHLSSDLFTHKVKALTDNDFDSNGDCREYTIYDVLLGSPNALTNKCASPPILKHFEKLLMVNELELDCFTKYRENFFDEIGNNGPSFRHVIHKPQDLSYKIISHDTKNIRHLDHLIPSDLDLLINRQRYQPERKEDTTLNPEASTTKKKKTEPTNGDDKNICAIVEFSLPKSTYATMALRELLHLDKTCLKKY